MIAIDGRHNGWRHLVLPIAHSDELVMNAVLAVSAFHFSISKARRDNLEAISSLGWLPSATFFIKPPRDSDSEGLYAQAISGLQRRQQLGTCDVQGGQSVILAILVLLVAVMVTGSDDFPILSRMLLSGFEAIGGEEGLGSGELAEFIIRQFHK